MKMNIQITVIAGLALFFFLINLNTVVLANERGDALKSLKNITGYQVTVKIAGSKLKKEGLSREQIQKDIEDKIKAAGITLLTPAERSREPGRPLLKVIITGFQLREVKKFVYNIDIKAYQDVILKRDPETIISAPTWSKRLAGTTSSLEDIREFAKTGVDMFIKSSRHGAGKKKG